jgi:hypothetical protein
MHGAIHSEPDAAILADRYNGVRCAIKILADAAGEFVLYS